MTYSIDGLESKSPTYQKRAFLAGDHMKECPNQCVPAAAVRVIYPEGYVRQNIRYAPILSASRMFKEYITKFHQPDLKAAAN